MLHQHLAARWRLSHTETMIGLPFLARPRPPVQQDHRPARLVLENLILDALTSNRSSFVLFSGGRDSSAVLAIAALVARREGLALPVPVIARHAASPDSHETVWQEMVLDHLGIGERIVLDFNGEQRVLGEVARTSIKRLGLLWPAAVHVQAAILRHIEDIINAWDFAQPVFGNGAVLFTNVGSVSKWSAP